MKNLMLVGILISTLFLSGCGAYWNHAAKSIWSDNIGLKYHVVLYTNDGHIIKEWHVKTNVDNSTGGHATFYDEQDNLTCISGTYIITQE